MKTVKEAWQEYLDEVVSKQAGATQIKETKGAFYSGALVMMNLSIKASTIENFDEAEKEFSKLNDEITTFAKEMVDEFNS